MDPTFFKRYFSIFENHWGQREKSIETPGDGGSLGQFMKRLEAEKCSTKREKSASPSVKKLNWQPHPSGPVFNLLFFLISEDFSDLFSCFLKTEWLLSSVLTEMWDCCSCCNIWIRQKMLKMQRNKISNLFRRQKRKELSLFNCICQNAPCSSFNLF